MRRIFAQSIRKLFNYFRNFTHHLYGTARSSSAVVFQPKYRLGHPEHYLFSRPTKVLSGSKYLKNVLFLLTTEILVLFSDSCLRVNQPEPIPKDTTSSPNHTKFRFDNAAQHSAPFCHQCLCLQN